MHMDNYTVTKGFHSELLVALRFIEQGYVPAFPLRPLAYDFIVDTGRQLVRVQAKQAVLLAARRRPKGGGDRARWGIRLIYKRGKENIRVRRERQEFDILAVVCRPDRIYVIPTSALPDHDGTGRFLPRHLEIKDELLNHRADIRKASARWLPYLNQFDLNEPNH